MTPIEAAKTCTHSNVVAPSITPRRIIRDSRSARHDGGGVHPPRRTTGPRRGRPPRRTARVFRAPKRNNVGVGRSTLATPERIAVVERELAQGAKIAAAAATAGVAPRTVSRWLEDGTVARRRLHSVPDLDLESGEALTDEQVETAMATAVIQAAQGGEWRAARFVLQARWPQRWAACVSGVRDWLRTLSRGRGRRGCGDRHP